VKRLSVYIITFNEVNKLKAALKSVQWADEVIVVDSHSTDGTIELAESMGAKVVQVDFQGFGHLRNEALKVCSHEWIFSLDSDERCTEEAKNEILDIVRSDSPKHLVWFMPRRNYFMGREIRYSGFYPDYRQPQLFKKDTMRYGMEKVHETFEILGNHNPGYLKNPIWQIPYWDFAEFQHKANRYSSLSAKKMKEKGKSSSLAYAFFRAVASFFKFYVIKLGFLDGWAGFVIALGNFEGTFFKYAKLHELDSSWGEP